MALLNNADAIYFGDRHVDRVYLGAQRVWPWTPELLFQNGEQGALYSLTPDFTGLYQDAAGTTPVTAVGQPVGLMLDRRFGLERGAPVLEEDWSSAGAGWVTQGIVAGESTVSYAGGEVTINYGTGGVAGGIYRDIALTPGSYELVAPARGAASSLRVSPQGTFTPVISEAMVTNPAGATRSLIFNTTGSVRIYLRAERDSQLVVGEIVIRSLPGSHASQPTTTARPALRSNPLRIDYDGADDFLRTTFPSALGSNVTIARSIPGEGAQILTGQTVGAEWDDNVTSCATLVIDRALSGSETALVTAFLNQQAGV